VEIWEEEKGKKTIPSKNKVLQDLEQNEENGYPDPDSNKTKINYTKEPNEVHKNSLKEILQVINENFIEMLLDMVNQNVQEALKKFQEDKNKEYEKTQKQINEIIGALNKCRTETETTINREINELRSKIDNIKEEVTHDMENLRKKSETEIQNKMEGHSSRIEQTEDRISELVDEMATKGKTEELLVKQLKTCEKKCRNSLHQKTKPENHGH
jgi:polyhydroxyalkanoate synthesis regulator phasin